MHSAVVELRCAAFGSEGEHTWLGELENRGEDSNGGPRELQEVEDRALEEAAPERTKGLAPERTLIRPKLSSWYGLERHASQLWVLVCQLRKSCVR